jgi:hypothetical protein
MRGITVSFRNLFTLTGMLAFAAFTATAGAESITGRVMGGGAPLTGVKVTLIRLNLSATTAADGLFDLKLPNTGLIPMTPRVDSRSRDLEAVGFHSGDREGLRGGRDLLGKSMEGALAFNRMITVDGRAQGPVTADASAHTSARALLRSAAAPDTVSFSKTGWFTEKTDVGVAAAKAMGDVAMERNIVGVGNTINDKYDRQVVDAYKNNGMDSSLAMVIKAMIMIESSGNATAISMYDTQLPCGTHSYGLIQVTPGCVKGYATLPAGTKVTATISGGLNTQPAVLTYMDPADKVSGNTTVQENGIIINLVTNPTNPFWPTSAFNPAYCINHGAMVVAGELTRVKKNSAGCTQAQYVALALGSYNQGFDGGNTSCLNINQNALSYSNSVLNKYRDYCKSAGQTAIY